MKQTGSTTTEVRPARLSVNTQVVVALLCLTNLLSYLDRTALSILLPPIQAEFMLSDTQLGVLTGLAFAAFYAIAGIPIAHLADRYSRVSIISMSVAAWSVATALTGAAGSFLQLFLARMSTAIGEAGALPPSHSLFSDMFPAERRAGVLALHSAFGPVGILLGLVLGGWLAVQVGWRWTFVLLGAPGLLLALVVFLVVKEPVRGRFDKSIVSIRPVGFYQTIRQLASKRSYVCLLIAFAIGSFVIAGLSQWLPSYFVRRFALTLAEVGSYYGIAFGCGSFLGMVCGAAIANRLTKRDLRWTMWLACVSYTIVFPLYLVVLWWDHFIGVIVVIFFASGVAGLGYGPAWAAIQNVSPAHMRATATAIALFGGSFLGAGLGPLAVGVLSDLAPMQTSAESLRVGLTAAVCFTPLPIYFFWLASRYFERDLESNDA